MEEFIEEFFSKLKYPLPYVTDEKSKCHEEEGHALIAKALHYIEANLADSSDEELDDAIMLLAANLDIHPWNNSALLKKSCKLYEQLITKYNNAQHFLSTRPQFCKKINKWIAKTLTRDLWQNYATVCEMYKWYCTNLMFPSVSEHLDILLPPSLLLIDSYDDELKISGVKCLCHIMNQCGKTELRWHGRAQVIYDALQKLSYTRHEPLVSVLHPAMIKILQVIEEDQDTMSEKKVDIIYQRLLSDMYLEDKLILRRTYALSAKLYITYLNTAVIKHLKKTMTVVLNYLEDSCGADEITRLTMLEVVQLLINLGKPRIQNYYSGIMKAQLKLIVDSAMLPIDSDVQEDIISRVTQIFKDMITTENSTDICESLNMIVKELPVKEDRRGKLIVERVGQILTALQP